ncbi:aldo/keto reductase [Tautonia plasticadhaerens]|uniref:General stress protein 69 n=1 Tax=Tautonia plasticadhaerens TaxID=2527974 RepID=A0A518HCQ4_9BACT|nr:aldo/keto reductase [Tautonia plasticadhaerens]QDV38436.1 General stress protein 69 [Tautonia plasticadhaerens]
MDTVTLGDSGPVVSRIGLGLAALGRPGYINLGHAADLRGGRTVEAMERHASEVLDLALASGVRYLDAARSYGRAEEFLARWLESRGVGPSDVTVGSKWGYVYTARWRVDADRHEVKDHSLDNLRRQSRESRDLLGGHLDLYQIHSATLESGVLDDPEVLGELARLKAEGLRIGLSLSGPRQAETLDKAMGVRVDGVRLFDAVQATWNLLERSAGPALAEARSIGLGVIVKEALANGRLTARNDDPAFADARLVLEGQADRLGTSIDALALAAALAQPWADVVLSGAASAEQLRSNLAATAVSWDEQADGAIAPLVEPPEAYWSTRSRLPWN